MISISYAYEAHGDVYKKMINSIPKGKFWDNREEVIPKSKEAYFTIETSHIDEIHYILISRESATEDAKQSQFNYVPTSGTFSIKVALGAGLNVIVVATEDGDMEDRAFSATYFANFIDSYAKDIYESSSRKLDRLERDIYVDEATRLASPLLSISKNLPDRHEQRTFGLQLIVRAMINHPGTKKAVEDMCKALFISSPIIQNIEMNSIADTSFPMYAGAEYELGKLITLWIRDPSMIRRHFAPLALHNIGNIPDYVDDNVMQADGYNEFTSTDEPLVQDYVSMEVEIDMEIEVELPRLDRNLPIPFTVEHPWCDRVYNAREHLDTNTSLDIATEDDPYENGQLGKQFVPYLYNGEKASQITKVIQNHDLASNSYMELEIASQAPITDLFLIPDSITELSPAGTVVGTLTTV